MISPKMFNQTSGYSNPQNNDDDVNDGMIALDNIVFTLMCKGETKLAKKFTRNYLKNFSSVYGGIYEE